MAGMDALRRRMHKHVRDQTPDNRRVLMKIKILQSITGNDPANGQLFSYGPDAEVEASEALAKDLVRAGYAVVIETKAERATSATPNKEIRRK
jgi:hypothetical protein